MVQDVLIAAAIATLGSAAAVVLAGSWARAVVRALARRRLMGLLFKLITGLAFGAFVLTSPALTYTEVMASTSVPPLLYLAVTLALFAAGIGAGRTMLRRRRADRRSGTGAPLPAR